MENKHSEDESIYALYIFKIIMLIHFLIIVIIAKYMDGKTLMKHSGNKNHFSEKDYHSNYYIKY